MKNEYFCIGLHVTISFVQSKMFFSSTVVVGVPLDHSRAFYTVKSTRRHHHTNISIGSAH